MSCQSRTMCVARLIVVVDVNIFEIIYAPPRTKQHNNILGGRSQNSFCFWGRSNGVID